jgi:hypothetical protein
MQTLHELIAEEEAKLEAKANAEIAAERAAWEALPQAEKDRINAERDAMWARLEDAADHGPEDEDDGEDQDDD